MTKQRKGFTLVELSIVLIIIGLIIGGVLKGTDLINSAKQKKVYNTWIKGWQVAINQYQDRTGQLLSDGGLNGGAAGAANGTFDGIDLATTNTVQARLREIGVDVPVTNTGGGPATSPDGGSYTIEGKNLTGLSIMSLKNVSFGGLNRNVMELTLVPNDVALAIDTMIDGTADAGLGDCRSTAGAATTTATATPWPAANATASTVLIAL